MNGILNKPTKNFKFINNCFYYIKTPQFIVSLLSSILIAALFWIIPRYIVPETIYHHETYIPQKEITVFQRDSNNLVLNRLKTNDLQIVYKGNTVKGLYLLNYSFKNTGNTPILSEDFIVPITINGGWNRIIEYNCIDSNNSYLKAQIIREISTDNGIITLPKILMNPNDYFTIILLVDTIPKNINVTSRIVGINELTIVNDTTVEKTRLEREELIKNQQIHNKIITRNLYIFLAITFAITIGVFLWGFIPLYLIPYFFKKKLDKIYNFKFEIWQARIILKYKREAEETLKNTDNNRIDEEYEFLHNEINEKIETMKRYNKEDAWSNNLRNLRNTADKIMKLKIQLITLRLLEMGLNIDQIKTATGLTEQEILALKNNN